MVFFLDGWKQLKSAKSEKMENLREWMAAMSELGFIVAVDC